MDEVDVYGRGVCCLSACAPADMTIEELTEIVNVIDPTGISTKWAKSEDESFKCGKPNPCECDRGTGRKHWLFNC